MSQPRLFIASGIFHPEPGGPATYLHELLPELLARGWSVRALSYGDAPTDGYPYPLTRVPRTALPLRLARYAAVARPLLGWADVVYAHTTGLPLYGSRRAPRIIKIVGDQAWERSIRKGWIAPDTDVDDFQSRRFGPLAEWQKRRRAADVRAMDAVVVPSAYLRDMVAGWGVPPEKIHVIYNALPPALDTGLTSQAEARDLLGLDPDRPLLLTAARLNPWKGVDHLMAALDAVPDLQLLVAGDGPDLPRLRALADGLGDRVRFLGRLPRIDLYRMMLAADYFALYSGYEGLPHTVLEALRVGTPVIASDKGGNSEVVVDGHNGFLVPYVDRDALRDVLRGAYAPGTRDALQADTGGDERFAFTHMVSQTHTVLSSYLR